MLGLERRKGREYCDKRILGATSGAPSAAAKYVSLTSIVFSSSSSQLCPVHTEDCVQAIWFTLSLRKCGVLWNPFEYPVKNLIQKHSCASHIPKYFDTSVPYLGVSGAPASAAFFVTQDATHFN